MQAGVHMLVTLATNNITLLDQCSKYEQIATLFLQCNMAAWGTKLPSTSALALDIPQHLPWLLIWSRSTVATSIHC